VQNYWNKIIGQESNNSVDVQFIDQKSIRNISGYFAKYMSKSQDKNCQGNGLKDRVIFCRSFGYSRNFKIFDKLTIHRNELLLEFPELEEKKVVKKISEDISIDYYFLDNKKVMNLLKYVDDLKREALGLSKSTL
jgi:hypothetical protein